MPYHYHGAYAESPAAYLAEKLAPVMIKEIEDELRAIEQDIASLVIYMSSDEMD